MPFIRTKDGSIPIIRKAEVFSNDTVHIKISHDPKPLDYSRSNNTRTRRSTYFNTSDQHTDGQ